MGIEQECEQTITFFKGDFNKGLCDIMWMGKTLLENCHPKVRYSQTSYSCNLQSQGGKAKLQS